MSGGVWQKFLIFLDYVSKTNYGFLYIDKKSNLKTRYRKGYDKYLELKDDDVICPKDDDNAALIEIFDSFEFRTRFIEDVEIRKAFNFGEVIAQRDIGIQLLYVYSDTGTCEMGNALKGKQILLENITLEDVPPFHAKCSYTLVQNI